MFGVLYSVAGAVPLGSRLTETFCLVLTPAPDEAAKRLFVYPNTIRYRIRPADQVLGRDPDSPKERPVMAS